MIKYINIVLRHRILFFGVVALFVLFAWANVLSHPVKYRASSTISPETGASAQPSQIAGIAAQFGVNLGVPSTGASLQYFAQLLTSHRILAQAALSEYTVVSGGDTLSGNLIELYDIEGETPNQRLRSVVERLKNESVSINANLEASLITLSVQTVWPELSIAINRRLIQLLQEFNIQERQSQAEAEKRFVQERLAEARDELAEAEADLQAFLEGNRSVESPDLRIQLERVQRRVRMREQVYTTLAQAYEQARIEQVRSTPVINVIDPAGNFVERQGRGLIRNSLLAVLFGSTIGIGLAGLAEHLRKRRESGAEDYEELMGHAREIRGLFSRG